MEPISWPAPIFGIKVGRYGIPVDPPTLVVDGGFMARSLSSFQSDGKADFDLGEELRPFEYNVCSKRMAKKLYSFDAKILVDGSDEYQYAVHYFSRIRDDDPDQQTTKERKGLLRIEL